MTAGPDSPSREDLPSREEGYLRNAHLICSELRLTPSPIQPTPKLHAALDHLEGSLQLLDDADAPAEIGAHVDLAIHRLREVLAKSEPAA